MKQQRFVPFGILLTCLSVGFVFAGCSGTAKKVEQRVAQETPAREPGELMVRGFEAWSSGANLDIDQKSSLWTLHSNTGKEAFRIRDEITKVKSAMFKELAKGDYDSKMIDGFKKKIVKLDQERLDIMFKALDAVEKILGRGRESREYFRYLEELEIHGFESQHR